MRDITPRPKKPRLGCLPSIALLILGGLLLVMLVELTIAPWIYIVGGHTRLLPVWAGIGEVATPSGRYSLHIWFSPSSASSRILPSTSVSGSASVCTPQGQRYQFKLSGGARGNIWKDMDGHEFHLYARYRPPFWSFTNTQQPFLEFSGRWVGNSLVMTDEGTVERTFLPDGRLNVDRARWPAKTAALPVTFAETSWWQGWGRCADAKSRGAD
jgi:hypothetical protein